MGLNPVEFGLHAGVSALMPLRGLHGPFAKSDTLQNYDNACAFVSGGALDAPMRNIKP